MKYLRDVATIAVAEEKCTGCGACMEVCPHNVFIIENRKASIADRDRCMECGACMMNCPSEALFVDKGVGCAAALINSMITGGEPTCGCSGDDGRESCC
jgi:NAD-dependent dihydropyrimidine dehydrogenase PreA subunit